MKTENIQIQKFFFRMMCGFFLGISVVAPGVSGSVLAVMMGIYPELIQIVSAPFKNFKRNLFYLIPLGLGAVISFGLFVLVFSFLFDNYPLQASVLFIGLILGGIPAIFKQATKGAFKKHYIVGALVAFLLAVVMGSFVHESPVAANHVSVVYLCISGFFGGVAGIIPGMSVSILLMLFGVYKYILDSAALFTTSILDSAALFSTDLMATASVIIPFVICFAVGMVLFSKAAKFLFDRYPSFAYYLVLGFVCGTVFSVFPRTMPDSVGSFIGCAVMFIVGILISFGFEWLGKRFNPDEEATKAV